LRLPIIAIPPLCGGKLKIQNSKFREDREEIKAPNSKIQAPEKLQAPRIKKVADMAYFRVNNAGQTGYEGLKPIP
jgi:hypothetical protein